MLLIIFIVLALCPGDAALLLGSRGSIGRQQTGSRYSTIVMSAHKHYVGHAEELSIGDSMELGWEKLRGKPLRRSLALWRFFTVGAFKTVRANRTDTPEVTALTAQWVKEGLLRLGPTMIKLGQVFSSRNDLLHPAYIDALQSLTDDVPVVSSRIVREIIEAELGRPVDEVFDAFEDKPLAGASLGQVHRARLKNSSIPVAIKIQRRSLRALFDTDFKNLRLLARVVDGWEAFQRRRQGRTGDVSRNWLEYTDDAADLLYKETDYEHEANNVEKFAASLPSELNVLVPTVFRNATTSRVLTMQFVPSAKLTRTDKLSDLGLDRAKLCRQVIDLFLTQLLETRVLHCDPHPGNLCVATDGSGRLVLYDFGMIDDIPVEAQAGMRKLALALFGGSAKPSDAELDEAGASLVNALEMMGFLSAKADRAAVQKVGRYVVGAFKAQQRGDEAEDVSATVGTELQGLVDNGEVAFPSIFTLVARAYTSIDGISRSLDPDFDFTKACEPFVGKLIQEEYEQQGAKQREAWAEEVRSVFFAPRRTAYVERTVRSMQSGDIELRSRSTKGEAALARLERRVDGVQNLLLASTCLNVALALGVRTLPVRPFLVVALSALAVSVLRARKALAGRDKS